MYARLFGPAVYDWTPDKVAFFVENQEACVFLVRMEALEKALRDVGYEFSKTPRDDYPSLIPDSSKGRTTVSDTVNQGSNPCSGAT